MLILVVVLLILGLILQFVYFLMKIRNLSSGKGDEKHEEEKIKDEKVEKNKNKHLKNSNSESFMTELVFTEEVEE